jgi:hypothetical protein
MNSWTSASLNLGNNNAARSSELKIATIEYQDAALVDNLRCYSLRPIKEYNPSFWKKKSHKEYNPRKYI